MRVAGAAGGRRGCVQAAPGAQATPGVQAAPGVRATTVPPCVECRCRSPSMRPRDAGPRFGSREATGAAQESADVPSDDRRTLGSRTRWPSAGHEASWGRAPHPTQAWMAATGGRGSHQLGRSPTRRRTSMAGTGAEARVGRSVATRRWTIGPVDPAVAATAIGTLHRDVTDTRPGDEGRPDSRSCPLPGSERASSSSSRSAATRSCPARASCPRPIPRSCSPTAAWSSSRMCSGASRRATTRARWTCSAASGSRASTTTSRKWAARHATTPCSRCSAIGASGTTSSARRSTGRGSC